MRETYRERAKRALSLSLRKPRPLDFFSSLLFLFSFSFTQRVASLVVHVVGSFHLNVPGFLICWTRLKVNDASSLYSHLVVCVCVWTHTHLGEEGRRQSGIRESVRSPRCFTYRDQMGMKKSKGLTHQTDSVLTDLAHANGTYILPMAISIGFQWTYRYVN